MPLKYFNNDADDVIDALLYFWGGIFDDDVNDDWFLEEIEKIVHPEKWEHYYSVSEYDDDDDDVESIIQNGEEAYFDLKESLEEENNFYDISAYDFGSTDDEDDKMVSYIENLYNKESDRKSNEDYHSSVKFEHIEAINDKYEFDPDIWFQGMIEFLRYGLTCLGFQCVDNLDIDKINNNLKKAIYIKDIILSMGCEDYETYESCIVVDRFEKASIEEGRCLIEKFVKIANYFWTDVIILAHIINDWSEELSIYFSKLFIDRLKNEEKSIRIIYLLRKFATLIDDCDTLKQCDEWEKDLMKPSDSIIFNRI